MGEATKPIPNYSASSPTNTSTHGTSNPSNRLSSHLTISTKKTTPSNFGHLKALRPTTNDLFLARSQTISPEAYLTLLAQNITRVQQTQGRLKQTLAQSSFSAWDKFYKQDENSPNAIVSYYQKGALAALCLDLIIREKSQANTPSTV